MHTLQLQMQYVSHSLEDEALDLAERNHNMALVLNRHAPWMRGCLATTLASQGSSVPDIQQTHLYISCTPFQSAATLALTGPHTCTCCRQGSSDEVALLIATFGLLDMRLASMRDVVDAGEAEFIDAEDLAGMAADVPDLCSRLGIE